MHNIALSLALTPNFHEANLVSQLPTDLSACYGDGTVNILDIFIVSRAFGSKLEDSKRARAKRPKIAWDYGKTV
jgi:hypothetical protein